MMTRKRSAPTGTDLLHFISTAIFSGIRDVETERFSELLPPPEGHSDGTPPSAKRTSGRRKKRLSYTTGRYRACHGSAPDSWQPGKYPFLLPGHRPYHSKNPDGATGTIDRRPPDGPLYTEIRMFLQIDKFSALALFIRQNTAFSIQVPGRRIKTFIIQ